MKAYYFLKNNNYEKYKMKERQKLDLAIKARKRLDDRYIESLLKTIRYGGKKNRKYYYLKEAHFPKELIESVKIQIKLRRKLRDKHGKNKINERPSRKDDTVI